MNKDRLLTLADFLDRKGKFKHLPPLPLGKLDLSAWAVPAAIALASHEADLMYAWEGPEKRRIQKLADSLKSVTKKGEAFLYKKNKKLAKDTERPEIRVVEMRDCRTAACACGWGTTIPEFKKAGLMLIGHEGSCSASLYYKGAMDMWAAEMFFDIPFGAACQLFTQDAYDDKDMHKPEAVAKRIRKTVKENAGKKDFVAKDKPEAVSIECLDEDAQ